MTINSHQVMIYRLLLHRFQQQESGDTLSKMKYRLALLSAAQQDVKKAEQLLSANTPAEEEAWPVMDFTHWPAVRYAVSGEVQTPESEAYFHRISAAAATIRSAITDAERAKGTSSFHILQKILASTALCLNGIKRWQIFSISRQWYFRGNDAGNTCLFSIANRQQRINKYYPPFIFAGASTPGAEK
jgi:hypothetical protein